MFCSLKNRIELQGKFFGILLLLLVLKKKNIHSECEISFYVVAGRVTHNAHPGFTGADLDGTGGQVL